MCDEASEGQEEWVLPSLSKDRVAEPGGSRTGSRSAEAKSTVRKAYLLDWYPCPFACGWHVGHNYLLGWGPLCVGEHK
jgi:hypothetical protein